MNKCREHLPHGGGRDDILIYGMGGGGSGGEVPVLEVQPTLRVSDYKGPLPGIYQPWSILNNTKTSLQKGAK